MKNLIKPNHKPSNLMRIGKNHSRPYEREKVYSVVKSNNEPSNGKITKRKRNYKSGPVVYLRFNRVRKQGDALGRLLSLGFLVSWPAAAGTRQKDHSSFISVRGSYIRMMTKMYDYMHKVTGNVCTDWRLTHPLLTSFESHAGEKVVNTQAFKVFLNQNYVSGEPGSCQDAGYTWKQLDFQASVQPASQKMSHQTFL